jgi:hypothetical protein
LIKARKQLDQGPQAAEVGAPFSVLDGPAS